MGKRASARARAPRGRRPRIDGRTLRVGDRQLPLYSGAVHYWRLARDAWAPALREVRNLGLPIVETYVPWSVHETAPGELDFGERDPRKDVGAFVDLAAEHDLLVFARPGPHINAEMTCFGLPERIVHDKACQARSARQNPVVLGFPPRMFPVPSYASKNYHREVGGWFDAVGEVLRSRIWPNGPIVLLQVDNEAAYYFRDGAYDQDYHPDAVALWTEFLEERYGDLEAVREAHATTYATWDDVQPPDRFRGREPRDLPLYLDWARFREHLLEHAIGRMRRRMARAGLGGVPVLHNFALGDEGQPTSLPGMSRVVDLVGLDYYHPAREHRTIKRRTLYLAGTVPFPYAPEMGVGAPPWFTPLTHEDSLYCTMAACAYGLRGFNLYMAVDRDRWYGSPIDARGTPRVEAGAWKTLVQRLTEAGFHDLERRAEVALVFPREYARLSRTTHCIGLVSPSTMEALGGTPVDGCREDDLGFAGPVQVLWWRMLAKLSDALTAAGIPYVYVDSEAPLERLEDKRVVIAPTYETVDPARWDALHEVAKRGATVVYGPALPTMDTRMRERSFDAPDGARCVLLDTPGDAEQLVAELAEELSLARPFRARPAPVETAVHEDGDGARVLFVMHPGREPADPTVELPEPMRLRDLLTGEELSGDGSVVVPIPAYGCRAFELERRGQEAR